MGAGRTTPRCRGAATSTPSGGWASPPPGWTWPTSRCGSPTAHEVAFDRLLIATGVRARPWPNAAEAALDGVFVVRTREDAARLRSGWPPDPGGCWSSAPGSPAPRSPRSAASSACRSPSPSAAPAPLVGALGGVIGAVAAEMQREHGVDLRCGVTVTALEGDAAGGCAAPTSPTAPRSTSTWRWSRSARSATSSGCAAPDWRRRRGASPATPAAAPSTSTGWSPTTSSSPATWPASRTRCTGTSSSRWSTGATPSPRPRSRRTTWSAPRPDRRPHLAVPAFWSVQFGVNIKSVGVPTFADEVVITQGSVAERRFVAVYGYKGRIVAAVSLQPGQVAGVLPSS